MKIVLAGASGAIGRVLLPLLVQKGQDVVGLAVSNAAADIVRALGGTPVVVNVYDLAGLAAALHQEHPDAVIDQLTSLSSWDDELNNRIRVEGTRNLVDAALEARVRRMVVQSYCIYAPGDGPADEDEPLNVDSAAYGSSAQALATLEATVSEMPEAVVLRYGTMYGPGTSDACSGDTADQARAGQVYVTDDVTSFMHVRDAAHSALLALEWPAGVFNIVDDEPATGAEWLPVYAEAVGAPPPPVDQTKALGLRGASNARARKQLGWEPLVSSWRHGFLDELA